MTLFKSKEKNMESMRKVIKWIFKNIKKCQLEINFFVFQYKDFLKFVNFSNLQNFFFQKIRYNFFNCFC